MMATLALGGCWTGGPKPVTAPSHSAPVAEPRLSGIVLVWADARLYLEPSADAPYVTLAHLPSHAEPLGAAAPMTVMSNAGGFIEVEPIDKNQQCGWITFSPPSDLEHVRVFVRRNELSPVLAHPFARQFVDGTRIALEPGVAVAHGADGYRVAVAGDIVTLPIPDNAVGLAFQPFDRAGEPDAPAQYEVSDAPARLGPNQLRVHTQLFTATVEARGNGTTLVSAHTPCRDFTLSLADGDVKAVSVGRGYGYSGRGRAASAARMVDYLPAGTVLRSGDHAVGTTLFPIVLPALRTTPPCVDRQWLLSTDGALGPDIEHAPAASATMHLCADPAAVVSGPLVVP